jgi:putative transcriptional regulator
MSDDGITKTKLSQAKAAKPDWSRFDAMSEDERHSAALADPDAQPARPDQLARGRQRPNVRAIREAMGLPVDAFAAKFGLLPALVREWEAGTKWPDRPAQILLRVIESEPDAVARVAAE